LRTKASYLVRIGHSGTALTFCEEAVTIVERLVCLRGHGDLEVSLSSIYSTRGEILLAVGEIQRSISLNEKAFRIRKRCLENHPSDTLRLETASLFGEVAESFVRFSLPAVASHFYKESLELLEDVVYHEGQVEYLANLACIQLRAALLLSTMNDPEQALLLLDKAIGSYKCLVNDFQRADLARDLAAAYEEKANLLITS
jgi:tetratricopeptide (TPR) repeat protein